MTANRILFAIVVIILALLVIAMLSLAAGTPDGSIGVANLLQLVIGVGIIVLIVRLLREGMHRR